MKDYKGHIETRLKLSEFRFQVALPWLPEGPTQSWAVILFTFLVPLAETVTSNRREVCSSHPILCGVFFFFPLFFLFISLCHTGPPASAFLVLTLRQLGPLYSPHPHKAVHLY